MQRKVWRRGIIKKNDEEVTGGERLVLERKWRKWRKWRRRTKKQQKHIKRNDGMMERR